MRTIKLRGKTQRGWKWIQSKSLEQHENYVALMHEGMWREIIPETLGQFTGLHDKDGREIYERDVISVKKATCHEYDFTGILYFQDATFCLKKLKQSDFAIKNGYADLVKFWNDGNHDHYSLEILCDGYCEIEIIGNIHDNPELLK